MVIFKIVKIDNALYTLKNKDSEKIIELLFEFYGVTPKIGDILILPKVLLDMSREEYAQPYAFEPVRVNEIFAENETAGLIQKNNKIILKRIFG